MSRPGRKRKSGARYPNGELVHARGESPAEVAARMPHRRPFGGLALDQRAESSIGRLELLGLVTAEQRIAGEMFRQLRNRYLAAIEAPRVATGKAAHGMLGCGGDRCTLEPDFCLCRASKRKYVDAVLALRDCGMAAMATVQVVAVLDDPCPPALLTELKFGLTALAEHFGLTRRWQCVQFPK